jgi:hypothetical protein
VNERCDRCGSAGQDRRTLHLAGFYALEELEIPFGREVLFDARLEDLETATGQVMVPEHVTGNQPRICLAPGRVRCRGELTPLQLYTLRVCKRCRAEWLASLQAWFRAAPTGQDHDADERRPPEVNSGIFIREITREEWDQRQAERGLPPGEPVRVIEDDGQPE